MGFKPIETEIPVEPGWIADIGSFVYPTYTESKRMKIIPSVEFEAEKTLWKDYEWLMSRHDGILTAIVEVKVSRADFNLDQIRKFNSQRPLPANLCYIAYPSGIIEDAEIPDGWIGIKCTSEGERVSKIIIDKAPFIHPQSVGSVVHFIASVAIRRDHRTRRCAARAFLKSLRAGKYPIRNLKN
jgi:hypothetical protein